MSDNKPYIFFRDGKLYACELPEGPYLPVSNPEVFNPTDDFYLHPVVDNDLYRWPGTLEKLNWTTLGNKGVCRMMDPHYKLILP